MGTSAEKHARQKQNRQAAGGTRAGRGPGGGTRRWLVPTLVVALLVVIGAVVLLFTGDDGSDDAADSTTTTSSTAPASTTAVPAAELPAPAEGIALDQPTPCPPAGGTEGRVQMFAGAPPTCIDPSATYTATFSTSEGEFTATLDPAAAPLTVNNFVVLSRYRYYDGVPFHRIVTGYVIQAGDGDGPDETGNWGSNDLGYSIPDELPESIDAYTDYSLVMANAGPDTNGSQFFVTLPGGGAALPGPNYSLFGQVTEGQDVIDAIGQLGGAGTGEQPSTAVVIESVTITETPAAG